MQFINLDNLVLTNVEAQAIMAERQKKRQERLRRKKEGEFTAAPQAEASPQEAPLQSARAAAGGDGAFGGAAEFAGAAGVGVEQSTREEAQR